jgi:hypothetical protein
MRWFTVVTTGKQGAQELHNSRERPLLAVCHECRLNCEGASLYQRWRRTLRVRQSGTDLKPPQGAAVKSRGREHCGNAGTKFRAMSKPGLASVLRLSHERIHDRPRSFRLLTRIRWINRCRDRPEGCLQTGKRCFTNRERRLGGAASHGCDGVRLSLGPPDTSVWL